MARQKVDGKWEIERETEKALLLKREDGQSRWFPKRHVDAPDDDGQIAVAGWLLQKDPLPPLLSETLGASGEEGESLVLPPSRRGPQWKRGAVSHSRITGFLGCPRSYFFGYEREPRIPGVLTQALGLGRSVHDALDRVFECDWAAAPPLKWLEAVLRQAWASERSEFDRNERARGKWSEEKLESALEQARWGLQHMGGEAVDPDELDRRSPRSREESLFSADGEIGGIVDAVFEDPDGTLRIVDFKSGRGPADEEIPDEHRRQGLLYAHLLQEQPGGRLPDGVEFWYLGQERVDTFAPDADEVTAVAEEVRAARGEILAMKGRPEEEWEARPDEETCRWCDAKPWCGPYRDHSARTPWKEQGFGRLVRGTVTDVAAPGGPRPGSATLRTDDGEELKVIGWRAAGKILSGLVPGQAVEAVDVQVKESKYSGRLEAIVGDPYSVVVDGRPVADASAGEPPAPVASMKDAGAVAPETPGPHDAGEPAETGGMSEPDPAADTTDPAATQTRLFD